MQSWRISFVFFLAVGYCWWADGLQHPLEYRYNYVGQLASGIYELRSQVAAVALKAMVTIQIKTDKGQGTAKLSNIEVGFYNGDVGCETRKMAPIEFEPVEEDVKKMLETTFGFRLLETKGNVMIFPVDEVEWVGNIRKSIIQMFLIQPIFWNFKKKPHAATNATQFSYNYFEVMENTILGRCLCQYSGSKLPQLKRNPKIRERISILPENDIQSDSKSGAGSSKLKIVEDLWLFTRSVNFTKCEERVMLQKANVGSRWKEGEAQNDFLQTHSLVSSFLMRGKIGAQRLESAIVEESLVINPIGQDAEKLQTRGNQTLNLIHVGNVETEMVIPQKTREVKTWSFEMASPFAKPKGKALPWINYYGKSISSIDSPLMPELFMTGWKVEKDIAKNLTDEILIMLEEVSTYVLNPPEPPSEDESPWSTTGGLMATQMYTISQALRGMDRDTMDKLWEEVFSELDQRAHIRQMLFIDACVASGDTVAIRSLLDNFIRAPNSDIDDIRAATVVLTLGHNLASPAVIQMLIPYLHHINFSLRPMQTATTIINFAIAINRLCNEATYHTSSPQSLFGIAMCDQKYVTEMLVPYFEDGIKAHSQPWRKAVFVQAIANLGIPSTIDLLKPFILGDSTKDTLLRSIAIQSVSSSNFPVQAKTQVIDALNIVMNTQDEVLRLRQDAFMCLLTWNPDATWWNTMARQTWFENSHQFAALITFTLEGLAKSTTPLYAEQSKIASLVLPLAKPYSPNYHYSFHKFMSQYLPEEKISTVMDIAWLTTFNNILPRELSVLLKSDFGGLKMDLFELHASIEGTDKLMEKIIDIFKPIPLDRDEKKMPSELNFTVANELLEELMETFNLEEEASVIKEADVVLTFLKNMKLFLPFNRQVMHKVFGQDGERLIHFMIHNYPLDLSKFFIPVMNEYYLPTSAGLPFIHTDAVSVLSNGEGYMLLRLGSKRETNVTFYEFMKETRFGLEYEADFRMTTKVISKSRVLAPWSLQGISVGIDHVKTLNLPMKGMVTCSSTGRARVYSIITEPIYDYVLFPLLYGHTVPYTAIEDTIPSSNFTNSTDLLPVAVEDSRRPVVQWDSDVGFDFTGIDVKFQWEADLRFAFREGNFLDLLRNPSRLLKYMLHPSVKFWKFAVLLNPAQSETRKIEQSHTLINYFEPAKSDDSPENKEDPTSKDYKQEYTQMSVDDTTEERTLKLSRILQTKLFKTTRHNLKFVGQLTDRTYDFSTSIVEKHHPNNLYRKYSLNCFLLLKEIPNYIERSITNCLDTGYEMPYLESIDSFRERLAHTEIRPRFSFIFKSGPRCENNDFGDIEVDINISEERRQRLLKELDSSCNTDVYEPLMDFRIVPTYDRIKGILRFLPGTPRTAKRIALWLEEMMKGIYFPYTKSFVFDVENKEDEVSVTGRRSVRVFYAPVLHAVLYYLLLGHPPLYKAIAALRPLDTDSWSFWEYKPIENIRYQNIYLPMSLTQIMPYKGFIPNKNNLLLQLEGYSEFESNCYISKHQIWTFDETKLTPTTLSPCWTLAITDTRTSNKWMVLVRRSQSTRGVEAKFISSSFDVVATMSSKATKVNGQPIGSEWYLKDPFGNRIFAIYKTRIGYKMTMRNTLMFEVGHGVSIKTSAASQGNLKGVCGNNDGKKDNDMVGPNSCLFKDPPLFLASWTSAKHCSNSAMEKLWSKVKALEETCDVMT